MKGKKTGGRKKGTPNKISAEIKEKLSKLLTGYITKKGLLTDFANLTPEKRVKYTIQILPYIIPKSQKLELDVNEPTFADLYMKALEIDPEEEEKL